MSIKLRRAWLTTVETMKLIMSQVQHQENNIDIKLLTQNCLKFHDHKNRSIWTRAHLALWHIIS